MRAAVLAGPGDLVVEDRPEPLAGDRDVVVQVAAAGVCGSDLASYATGAYVRPGQVLGHEFAGRVVLAGDQVHGIGVGDRVAVRPLGQCGRCDACVAGRPHVCDRAIRDAVGYGRPGAFAERVTVPEAVLGDNVVRVPDSVGDEAAAMIEVYAVALRACRRLAVPDGGSCVVLGLGPVGLAAVQVLRALGVERVVGVDHSALRRETAVASGAAAVADADRMEQVVRHVAGAGPRGRGAGADTVLDASGAPALLDAAPGLVRSGGRIALVALYKEPVALDLTTWVTRELELVGCFGYDSEFADAADLVAAGRVDPASLITATFPLERIAEAFAAQADAAHHVKVQVRPIPSQEAHRDAS